MAPMQTSRTTCLDSRAKHGAVAALTALLLTTALVASSRAQEQTVGLFFNHPGSFTGYTLFAPNPYTTTYLIDMQGRLVHAWPSDYRPGFTAYLLENGDLLRTAKMPGHTPGGGGRIQRFDWDGNLLWDYLYYDDVVWQHHDIEPLPGGNVLILAWETISRAEAIAAGRDPDLLNGSSLQPEHIVEVMPTGPTTGEIVWQWHLLDHVIQDFDPAQDNHGVVAEHPELVDINYVNTLGADWIHANAIDYNPELDQIVISSRALSEVWIIDHSTTTAEAAAHTGGACGMGGDILYRWGNPQVYDAGTEDDRKLFFEHDAHWIAAGLGGAGNLLVFNNGEGRPDGNYSSVDEITPPLAGGCYPQPSYGQPHGPAAQSWTYTASDPETFFSAHLSSAQRLPNGNTLICSGDSGTFFEITPGEEIVWYYVSPVDGDGPVEQGTSPIQNPVFRAWRYAPDYPGLAGRDLTPGDPIEINPTAVATDGSETGDGTAGRVRLSSFPNPFNPRTTITFTTDARAPVVITVFDLHGRPVAVPVDREYGAGEHRLVWDGRSDDGRELPSGTYLVKVETCHGTAVRKILLAR